MSSLADFTIPKRARRTLAALIPVICTDEVEELGLVEQVVDHVELSMRSFPGYLRAALLAGITTFELGALVLPSSRGRGFSRLGLEERERYYARWWDSPIGAQRQLAKGLKGVIALGYWENPVVRERIGYRPDPFIAAVTARRLRDYGAEIERQERMVIEPDPLVPVGSLRRRRSDGPTS